MVKCKVSEIGGNGRKQEPTSIGAALSYPPEAVTSAKPVSNA
jgi:hypothetical protein